MRLSAGYTTNRSRECNSLRFYGIVGGETRNQSEFEGFLSGQPTIEQEELLR